MVIFSTWLLPVMSSKYFKLALILFEKFYFSQGNLKNAVHQILDTFCIITPPNLDAFKLMICHFNGFRKSFKIMYWKLKSIEIWLCDLEKHFRAFHIFRTSQTYFESAITEHYRHFVQHMTNISKALLMSNMHGFQRTIILKCLASILIWCMKT